MDVKPLEIRYYDRKVHFTGKDQKGGTNMKESRITNVNEARKAINGVKSFEGLKELLGRCDSHNALLEIWRAAHLLETGDKTIPKNPSKDPKKKGEPICKDSFSWDGYVDKCQYESSKNKILFILKENYVHGEYMYIRENFWFRMCVEDREINNYTTSIEEIQTKICGFVNLHEIAYINLNKRGGFSESNNHLKFYIDKYKKFITKQIELLIPDVIVLCMDTKLFSEVKIHCLDSISNNINDIDVYHFYHPEYKKRNKKAYEEKLRNPRHYCIHKHNGMLQYRTN